ncbi:hypothetical protein U27_03473 [Candidatus Vecturithrix granuli]|uniref:Uncharacterized protein n=1 Tax=Vecturithrix granuli TaxID=1499967 RepID=A0A081BW06_VECG1|nr:hypothetical protein U27_03473 [Candidatus Vecturithrix granuli]
MIKKIFYILFGILIMTLFVGTTGYLYSKSQAPPVIFETESPVIADIQNFTIASGMIIPRKFVL